MITARKKSKKIKLSRSDIAFNIIVYGFSIIFLIIVLYPLYFMFIASFSDPYAVSSGQMWFYPVGFNVEGYTELLKHSDVWTGYRNTIAYTIVGTMIGLAVNIPAAYALSRRDLVGRGVINLYFIFTMFFSGGLIPTYLVVKDFNLNNTFWVMVLPFSVSVYNIIVSRTFFRSSLPADLADAAAIDGCGNLRFFTQIALPLSKAVIAVIALWTAVGHWNSYFNALIYIQNRNLYPLQLVLRDVLITNNIQSALGTGEAAQIALRKAALMRYSIIIISTAPIMTIYPFAQKYFNQGVMIGAVKG